MELRTFREELKADEVRGGEVRFGTVRFGEDRSETICFGEVKESLLRVDIKA